MNYRSNLVFELKKLHGGIDLTANFYSFQDTLKSKT